MEIEWLGNSTFIIKSSTGKRICIDPFNGLKISNNSIKADIITLSKNINTTSLYDKANDNFTIICNNETYKENDIKIKGYLSFSDKFKGLKRGSNYIYTYEINSTKLCHLGYLGEYINAELINNLKYMDFLFLPIGGEMCLDGEEAYKLCSVLSPKYIIPMCYNSKGFDFYFDGPKKFLSSTKNILKLNTNSINTSELPKNNKPLTLLLTK